MVLNKMNSKERASERSDTILSQNEKLKDQAIVKADFVKSEETKRAGEKALKEAERIRSNFECKQTELDNRVVGIRRQEGELDKKIDTAAETLMPHSERMLHLESEWTGF